MATEVQALGHLAHVGYGMQDMSDSLDSGMGFLFRAVEEDQAHTTPGLDLYA